MEASLLLEHLNLVENIMKRTFCLLFLSLVLYSCVVMRDNDRKQGFVDLYSDTWVATDAIGRIMPDLDSVGPVRTDRRRVVGMFYITWHTQKMYRLPAPYKGDVSKVLAESPAASRDKDDPAWGKYRYYHWGEPEMGYFLSQDEWVIRKDMSMLSDAGVDVLVLDVTNAVRYWDEWEVLFSTMQQMRKEGNRTPEFVFWCFNGDVIQVAQDLYERVYKENRYSDLWFYWDEKPLLLYNREPHMDANGGYKAYKDGKSDYSEEVKSFFTLRNMWWGYYEWDGKRYIGCEDNWSFGYSMADERIKSMKPEELLSTHNGVREEAAVTPAQHPVTMTDVPMGVGKSWSRKYGQPALNEVDMPDSAYVPWLGRFVKNPEGYGIYFQERWDEAIEADPQFLYLNDWNEWTAIKSKREADWLGRHNPFIFVDQYNAEFNRTIQPAKGGYTDNYYMQMAQNIRRFKGVRPVPENRGFAKIKIDGSFRDWNRLKVVYQDTRNDVVHRDANGYGGLHYTDSSGRNDIIESKVAMGKEAVSFFVRTSADLTPCTDPNWMLLLIDADQDSSTGWYGYDFLINKGRIADGKSEIMKYEDGQWVSAGDACFAVVGNCMELSVDKNVLGISGDAASFDFKWADNPAELADPISLCLHGDSAPNRRFNYRYVWKK